MASPLLEMRGIDKRYPGVDALKQVDLTLEAGEVLALMGENGACLLYTSDAADE